MPDTTPTTSLSMDTKTIHPGLSSPTASKRPSSWRGSLKPPSPPSLLPRAPLTFSWPKVPQAEQVCQHKCQKGTPAASTCPSWWPGGRDFRSAEKTYNLKGTMYDSLKIMQSCTACSPRPLIKKNKTCCQLFPYIIWHLTVYSLLLMDSNIYHLVSPYMLGLENT